MRASLRLAVLVPALLCLPLLALGQPGADKGDKGAIDESKIRKKMLDGKYLEGVISDADLDGEEKTMTIKAEWEVKKANPEGQKRYLELKRQYDDAYRRRDAGKVKELYGQLLEAGKLTYDVEKMPFEFKLKITPQTKVRREVLPPKDPDDPKAKYTAAEISKLKGTGGLPGYTADFKDIQINETIVQVTIDKGKVKTAPKDTPTKDKASDKDKAEKTDKDPAEEVYPVSIIMIAKPPKELPGNPFLGK
jgi:hypothetical protein